MAAPRYQGILARLNDLQEAQKAGLDDSILRDDIDDLIEELLLSAARQFDFKRLSALLEDRRALDFVALKKVAEFFRNMKWDGSVTLTGALTVDPEEILRALGGDIDRLEDLHRKDPANSNALALDIIIGGELLRLTMCAIRQGHSLAALVELVKTKINLLKAPQVALLWSLVQREFDQDRDVKLEQAENILPKEFLQFQNDANAREKLTYYIVEWKPKLMLALYGRQGAGYPLDVPSLASVLTWQSSDIPVGVPLQEIRLAKSIQRIVEIAADYLDRTPEEIAAAILIDPLSPLVRPTRKVGKGVVNAITALSYEIRKAAQLLADLSLKDSDFAECLRRYKLGLEVMAPEINGSFASKNEVLLQKELARFALEHGFFVIGTRFGRSETDLVSWEQEALYIVETKLFRTNYQANSRAITNALAQLSSYMDQHPTTPFGVLVLYNLSAIQISAPIRWIRQRFLIITINLQPGPPSDRRQVLEIVEADDDSMIKILKIGQPSGRKLETTIKRSVKLK